MGVLPLEFKPGENAESLGLTGKESYTIHIDDTLKPRQDVRVEVTDEKGVTRTIITTCRVDTPVEVDYYRNGGILQTVLRHFLKG
jgi:aconitate hydratase